jgi:hypothetical protein
LLARLAAEIRPRHPVDQDRPDAAAGLVRGGQEVVARLVDRLGRGARRHLFDDHFDGRARKLDGGA